ncbi:MAG: alpha/beta hydrolase [Patescibacteria group bacterium]|nr:alpha/beta hydrolase [Patescibacteria group bacterium]
MKQRVYVVHGWDGYPEEGWFPWLKQELESRDFEVSIFTMPHPENPTIVDWVGLLKDEIKYPDENTHFVGHSVGCQTVLRYLESISQKLPYFEAVGKKYREKSLSYSKVGSVVLVAPWMTLTLEAMSDEESKSIARPWIETSIDFRRIKNAAESFTCIFSEDDPLVPFEENKELFEKELNAKIIIETGKGHFSGDDGLSELPSVLDNL